MTVIATCADAGALGGCADHDTQGPLPLRQEPSGRASGAGPRTLRDGEEGGRGPA